MENENFTAITDSENGSMGRLWWTAESEAELKTETERLTQQGARIVSIEREEDRDVIHYVFELDKSQALTILGYQPDEEEWLTQDDADSPARPKP